MARGTSVHIPLVHTSATTLQRSLANAVLLWGALYPAAKPISREGGHLTVLVTKGEGHNGSTTPVPKMLTSPKQLPHQSSQTETERKNEKATTHQRARVSLGICNFGNMQSVMSKAATLKDLMDKLRGGETEQPDLPDAVRQYIW